MPTQSSSLPLEVDLSSLILPVRDQGPRGTCTAFAATALHEAERAAGTGAFLALSEEVLYWGAKQADKNHTPGTSFRSIHMVLGRWGQPEAALWPYDPRRNDGDASYAPPSEAIDPANCLRGRLEPIPLDMTSLSAHIAGGRTVAASVQMSIGFFTAINGVVPIPQPHELIADNHAVLLTGYRDGGEVFRFRNSWGIGWGSYGYGELHYDYLAQYGKSAYAFRIEA